MSGQTKETAIIVDMPPPVQGTIRRTSINRPGQKKLEGRQDVKEFQDKARQSMDNTEMTYVSMIISGLNNKMTAESFINVVMGTLKRAGVIDTKKSEQEVEVRETLTDIYEKGGA